MIKFVVYDDEKIFINKTEDVITKIMLKMDAEYEIEKYNKVDNKFLDTISDNTNKIYIMDIEVPNNPSGIDVARRIRINDWNSIIVLVTSHVDMGYDALKAQIMLLDFISKYNDYESNLKATLKKAISKVNNKKVLVFDINGITNKVYTDDILYIVKDSVERKCIIKTIYNEVRVNETINDLLGKLDERFYLTHRSCIVNIERINKIDWKNNMIYFKNSCEKTDYIARDKKKGLKEYVRNS